MSAYTLFLNDEWDITLNEDGKIKLERKQDMKKRGVSSPDRADALALSLGTNIAHFSGMLDFY